MTSASGRYVIVFNGEIYNFQRLRESTSHAASGAGHSDTEVLLAAIEAWGLERALGESHRHVRVRAVGSPRADPLARPRPRRREAALLRARRASRCSSPRS